MALSCPVDLDTMKLAAEVQAMYTRVADDPSGEFHFHRGPAFAVDRLGYAAEALSALPSSTTASFAGVANPHAVAPIQRGETVVDIGSGAGTDLLLAARAVGPTGRAIGVDFTEAMREKAIAAARSLGLGHVEVRAGDALALPVDDDSVDVVISNGVLNLVPDKLAAFGEVLRVLKPGGRLQLADVVMRATLSEKARSDIELWAG
jgi:arsenite methyltransferase